MTVEEFKKRCKYRYDNELQTFHDCAVCDNCDVSLIFNRNDIRVITLFCYATGKKFKTDSLHICDKFKTRLGS